MVRHSSPYVRVLYLVKLAAGKIVACEDLHRKGASDREIAVQLKVPEEQVKWWRQSAGLASAKKSGGAVPVTGAEHARRMNLYRLGWPDSRIGRACGLSPTGVREWRIRYGLSAKNPSGRKLEPATLPEAANDRRLVLYRRGLSDGSIARNVGVTPAAIQHWRRRRGLVANVPERDWDRPATSIVSMDAELGKGGINRHSFIADDAASAWLEEMGASVW